MMKKNQSDICTYKSPTNHTPYSTHNENFKTGLNNIPMVTHVHGLEVRPTFDGNPMSWLGKNG